MNNEEHMRFMKEAIELSKESVASGGGPFGAIVVRNGQIVGKGMNRVTAWNDPTAHAEIVAIRDACKSLNSFKLDGCILYTSCEPCSMCLGSIYWSRLKEVYFANTQHDAADIGFDDAFIYTEIGKEHHERSIMFTQIMKTEALEAFEIWSKEDGRVQY